MTSKKDNLKKNEDDLKQTTSRHCLDAHVHKTPISFLDSKSFFGPNRYDYDFI